MKILFYADTVSGFGGVQRVLSVIAKGLAARHSVTILTNDTAAGPSDYDYGASGVSFDYITYDSRHDAQYYMCKLASLAYKMGPKKQYAHAVYSRSFFLPRYRRALTEKINAGHYDAVIAVHAFFSLHLAAVRRHLNTRMAIGWIHNSYEALFVKAHPYLPYLRSFFAYEMKKLNAVVTLTFDDAALFHARLALNNVKTIYNPLTITPRGHGGIEHKKFLSMGRFSPRHKGFDILIEAFAIFARENKEWTLEIVGEGEEEPLCRSLIEHYGLGERASILPFTTDVQGCYAGASVYVLSSRWEGFGLVLLEAMSHSLPVISSDIPSSKEILSNSGAHILFPSGDAGQLAAAMKRMATGADYAAMSAAALRHASLFSPEEAGKQWEELAGRRSRNKRTAGQSPSAEMTETKDASRQPPQESTKDER